MISSATASQTDGTNGGVDEVDRNGDGLRGHFERGGSSFNRIFKDTKDKFKNIVSHSTTDRTHRNIVRLEPNIKKGRESNGNVGFPRGAGKVSHSGLNFVLPSSLVSLEEEPKKMARDGSSNRKDHSMFGSEGKNTRKLQKKRPKASSDQSGNKKSKGVRSGETSAEREAGRDAEVAGDDTKQSNADRSSKPALPNERMAPESSERSTNITEPPTNDILPQKEKTDTPKGKENSFAHLKSKKDILNGLLSNKVIEISEDSYYKSDSKYYSRNGEFLDHYCKAGSFKNKPEKPIDQQRKERQIEIGKLVKRESIERQNDQNSPVQNQKNRFEASKGRVDEEPDQMNEKDQNFIDKTEDDKRTVQERERVGPGSGQRPVLGMWPASLETISEQDEEEYSDSERMTGKVLSTAIPNPFVLPSFSWEEKPAPLLDMELRSLLALTPNVDPLLAATNQQGQDECHDQGWSFFEQARTPFPSLSRQPESLLGNGPHMGSGEATKDRRSAPEYEGQERTYSKSSSISGDSGNASDPFFLSVSSSEESVASRTPDPFLISATQGVSATDQMPSSAGESRNVFANRLPEDSASHSGKDEHATDRSSSNPKTSFQGSSASSEGHGSTHSGSPLTSVDSEADGVFPHAPRPASWFQEKSETPMPGRQPSHVTGTPSFGINPSFPVSSASEPSVRTTSFPGFQHDAQGNQKPESRFSDDSGEYPTFAQVMNFSANKLQKYFTFKSKNPESPSSENGYFKSRSRSNTDSSGRSSIRRRLSRLWHGLSPRASKDSPLQRSKSIGSLGRSLSKTFRGLRGRKRSGTT